MKPKKTLAQLTCAYRSVNTEKCSTTGMRCDYKDDKTKCPDWQRLVKGDSK